MLDTMVVRAFKSFENLELELGQVNVFIGANGSGKTNLLEGIGLLSASAAGKVNDQTLLQRGVRPGVPKLYKAAFKKSESPMHPHIFLGGSGSSGKFEVSLSNPLKDPSPHWRFKTENWLSDDGTQLASRGPRIQRRYNPESGLAALKVTEVDPNDPAAVFLKALQNYVIYSPSTAVLRGIATETQPTTPVGLTGGNLPNAVKELRRLRDQDDRVKTICQQALSMINWAKAFGSTASANIALSPSASASPRVIKFVDRFMRDGRNVLSGYDASEGALYVLFLAVVAGHPRSPAICAIDNVDQGLNPRLAQMLSERFVQWILSSDRPRQVLLTSHNPAVLDGLPLMDDRVRLFAVDRDNRGHTVVSRIKVDKKLLAFREEGWPLSRLWMNGLIGGVPNV